jgi:hypothetical protein
LDCPLAERPDPGRDLRRANGPEATRLRGRRRPLGGAGDRSMFAALRHRERCAFSRAAGDRSVAPDGRFRHESESRSDGPEYLVSRFRGPAASALVPGDDGLLSGDAVSRLSASARPRPIAEPITVSMRPCFKTIPSTCPRRAGEPFVRRESDGYRDVHRSAATALAHCAAGVSGACATRGGARSNPSREMLPYASSSSILLAAASNLAMRKLRI